ncbi:uncharacterized protein [Clytia hemisphaerica]|uniref:FZ domain-containing protein n=1 Tax=Clytia hemisphaerica TaxID=252671 RepID=A0A7M5UVK7_9CNID
MWMKRLVYLLLFCFIILNIRVSPITSSSCRIYNGKICHESSGMMLDIPVGVTDAEIDQDVATFTRSHHRRQRTCKQQIANYVCAVKYPLCFHHEEKKIWKRLPMCRQSCQLAKDGAICRDLKFYQYLPRIQSFIDANDCNILPEYRSRDNSCIPFSFLNHDESKMNDRRCLKGLRSKGKTHAIQASVGASKSKTRRMLRKNFPNQNLSDVKCHVKQRPVSMNNMTSLPNFNKDWLANATSSVICVSEKGKVKFEVFSTIIPLYSPDEYTSLENVSVAIQTDLTSEESGLVAFGEYHICYQDNFQYIMQTNEAGITVLLYALAIKDETKLAFVERYFGVLPIFDKRILRFFDNFGIFHLLTFENLKWSVIWDEEQKRFDLLQSRKGSSLLTLPTMSGDLVYKEKNVDLESPEIFLGSFGSFLAMSFEVHGLSFMDFIRTSFSTKFGYIGDAMSDLNVPKLLVLEKASYFVRTSGNFTNKISKDTEVPAFKDSTIVSKMLHSKDYKAVFKGFGKAIGDKNILYSGGYGGLDTRWLENVTFQMESVILATTNKQEFQITFNYENVVCKEPEKEEPEKPDIGNLQFYFLEEALNFYKQVTKRCCSCKYQSTERKIPFTNQCSQLNQTRLAALKIYDFEDLSKVSLHITASNGYVETQHVFTGIKMKYVRYYLNHLSYIPRLGGYDDISKDENDCFSKKY